MKALGKSVVVLTEQFNRDMFNKLYTQSILFQICKDTKEVSRRRKGYFFIFIHCTCVLMHAFFFIYRFISFFIYIHFFKFLFLFLYLFIVLFCFASLLVCLIKIAILMNYDFEWSRAKAEFDQRYGVCVQHVQVYKIEKN